MNRNIRGKIYKQRKIPSTYALQDQERAPSVLGNRPQIPEAQGQEGSERLGLGSFHSEGSGDRARVEKESFDTGAATPEQKEFDMDLVSVGNTYTFCYERSRTIIDDRDSEEFGLFSRDLVCDGNCRRCPA